MLRVAVIPMKTPSQMNAAIPANGMAMHHHLYCIAELITAESLVINEKMYCKPLP